MNEIGAEQAVAWRGLKVLKAWRWHRVGKNGDSLTPVPPTLTFPPWGHMPTDSCASASHQVLTPQLISKEPVLPADPNISSLHPSQGLLGLGCQGRGSGSREGTPLTCFHLTGWLLVSEESWPTFLSLSLSRPCPPPSLSVSLPPSLSLSGPPLFCTARASWIWTKGYGAFMYHSVPST